MNHLLGQQLSNTFFLNLLHIKKAPYIGAITLFSLLNELYITYISLNKSSISSILL